MIWLQINKRYDLLRHDPMQSVQQWRADVCACDDEGENTFVVGRLLADQIERFDAEEWGHNPFTVADSDSGGLLEAYEMVYAGEGPRELLHCNFVYIYRYVLHPDFAEWKLAALDGFCRQFPCETLIVAQPGTIWLSEVEFNSVGFGLIEDVLQHRSPRLEHPAPDLIVRDMTLNTQVPVSKYPTKVRPASALHEQWVESELPRDATFC